MYLCHAGVRRGSCASPWRLIGTSVFKQYHSSSNESNTPGDGSLLHASQADVFAEHTVPQIDLGIFNAGATALDALHSASGLPWWAVIPTAAIAVKTLLLPVSLRQAKIVRTNMVLWKESYEFVHQQEKRTEHQAAVSAATAAQTSTAQAVAVGWHQAGATANTSQHQPGYQQQQQQQEPNSQLSKTAEALHQLQQWHARLRVFHNLRRKCAVPHPAWFMVNQCLQFPVFLYSSACIRNMAQANWPHFSQEGLLWFQDLTQAAVHFTQQGAHLAMGVPGVLLPLAVTAIMLTSIRLGFKASGAASKHPSVADTWLSPFLAYLPPVLYSLTLASTYLKVQLPQAVVLHWLTTSSYTLTLQLGLKSPRVRRLLGYTQPGLAAGAGAVDPAVAAQANAMDNADILVVMGAKHAALQRYNEALYCLHRALQLDPNNVRAHYSAGQIHALQHQWPQSEECYRKCAQLAQDQQSKGQALYCLGVACHQQQKFAEALDAYNQVVDADTSILSMLVLGRVRALRELGRHVEAKGLAEEFLTSDLARSASPVVVDAIRGKTGVAL